MLPLKNNLATQVVLFATLCTLTGCNNYNPSLSDQSVVVESISWRFKPAKFELTGELKSRILLRISEKPDAYEEDTHYPLESGRYLLIGDDTYDIATDFLLLQNPKGDKLWNMKGIGPEIDKLLTPQSPEILH